MEGQNGPQEVLYLVQYFLGIPLYNNYPLLKTH